MILGLNKIDADAQAEASCPSSSSTATCWTSWRWCPLSALNGRERGRCSPSACSPHLPEGEPLYPEDFLTDQPERFFVAEMVREQILRLTREEIPYTTGVVIESFKEEEPSSCASRPRSASSATARRRILIGKGGAMLKAIGTEARKEIEAFLGAKVFLGLFVKVRESWREDQGLLEEMGLGKTAE